MHYKEEDRLQDALYLILENLVFNLLNLITGATHQYVHLQVDLCLFLLEATS